MKTLDVQTQSDAGPANSPGVRLRYSLAARISGLMVLVMLSTGASALVILGQLRDLRTSFDLMTGVYLPFQDRLNAAQLQSVKIRAQVDRNAGEGPAELSDFGEGDLLNFSDALEERARLVDHARQPIDEALNYPDRLGGDEMVEPFERLAAQLDDLQQAVELDDADDPLTVLRDVRGQANISAQFRAIKDTSDSAIRSQRQAVAEAGRRAQNLILVVASAGAFLAALATIAVILTLRPLRRLSEGVRQLGRGEWGQRIELGQGDPEGDDEVRRLAREFNLMGAALQEREVRLIRQERLAAVGQLASQITHEIRNPLSSVGLNAELLEDELEDATPEARKILGQIAREVDRLTAITESYLAFARRPAPVLGTLDLRKLWSDTIEFHRPEFEQEDIELRERLGPGPFHVEGDPDQLRQALLNLLRNAREAITEAREGDSTRPATCEVALERKGDELLTLISDTGNGIASEQQERVFEAFFTQKAKGTGLGLPMVMQVISDHGGQVSIASSGPQGTVFELRLPACAPKPASVSSSDSAVEG